MAVIDSNNFITHLVWSGLIDKATCGELKEAIELCTVKDIYTKADVVAMLEDLLMEIKHTVTMEEDASSNEDLVKRNNVMKVVQFRIDKLRGGENGNPNM